MSIQNLVKDYPDFPKKGIIFKDLLPIFAEPKVFQNLIKTFSETNIIKEADAIISIDARGFLLGSAIVLLASKPMIVARKPRKLPWDLITKNFE